VTENPSETPQNEHQQPMEMNRRQAIAGSISMGLIIICGGAYEYLHPEFPKTGPVKAKQKDLPADFYEVGSQAKLDIATFQTKDSQASFITDCYAAPDNRTVEEVASVHLASLANSLTLGYTDHLEDWIKYAQDFIIKSRRIRIPASAINADFTEPDVFTSQHSLARIARTFGAFPLEILNSNRLNEYALVGNLILKAPAYSAKQNGIADIQNKRAVSAVFGRESGKFRTAIGQDALRRLCYIIDQDISNTTDTYNDLEFAQLAIDSNFTQEMIDEPDFYNSGLSQIAVPKVDRLVELFSGDLILPEDANFDKSVHQQQLLMLRRLTARYEVVPAGYYKVLRNFKIKNKRTPLYYEELAAA